MRPCGFSGSWRSTANPIFRPLSSAPTVTGRFLGPRWNVFWPLPLSPRSALESIDDQARQHLDELLRQNPVPPRATSDYQPLLEDSHDSPPPGKHPSDEESQ